MDWDFEIELWAHSHYKTKEIIQIQIFCVTKINKEFGREFFELIEKELFENNRQEFKPEESYIAKVKVHRDKVDGLWVELIDKKAIKNSKCIKIKDNPTGVGGEDEIGNKV